MDCWDESDERADKWSGDKTSGADDRAVSTVLPLEDGCIRLRYVRGRTAVKENSGPLRRCEKERLDFHLRADGEHNGLWTGKTTVLLLSLPDSVLTAGKESSRGNTDDCFIPRSRMSYAVLWWRPDHNIWNWEPHEQWHSAETRLLRFGGMMRKSSQRFTLPLHLASSE